MRFVLVVLLPLATATMEVNLAISPTNCLFGVIDALALLGFGDIPETAGYYDGKCASTLFTTSLVANLDKYCDPEATTEGWTKLTEYCDEYGEHTVLAPLDDVRAQIPSELETVDPVALTGTVMNSTVLLTPESFEQGKHTEDAWQREMNFHHAFGWSMYILFGITVLVASVSRLYSKLRPDSHGLTGSYWFQKHVALPALFGKRHAEPWRLFSLPTRLQAIMIFLYVLINFVFCCADYDLFTGNLYWSDTGTQLARYIADRTGIICFYNLPLLWCLAGRNDIFLWLTGWSYATASLFHRWIAFVATVQAVVHSIAYTWLEKDYLAIEWAEMYWRTGVFATVIMCLMLVCSLRPVRTHFYEIFLIGHILMAVVCLVLLWYHVEIFDGDYNAWLWACIGVWGLDRLIRICRMVILSFRAVGGPNTRASLTYKETGLIRLSVTPSIPVRPSPGHYYYIYSPWSWSPWENHPLTLASWSEGQLHFLIGPKKGATRRLQRRLEGANHQDMRIVLEGPYGQTHNLERFNHVVLVAGGSGITAIIPYVRNVKNPSMTIVWAISHEDYAMDVLEHELKGYSVDLYITREGAVDKESPHHWYYARPDMGDVVSRGAKQGDNVAVLACGPGGMMDDARAAVVRQQNREGSRVTYFEDAFGW